MRWGDILRIKSEFPSNPWPNGVQAYNRWVYEHLLRNTPYDVMVRELLLSQGSNFRSAAVNFYRGFQKRTPENFYKNFTLIPKNGSGGQDRYITKKALNFFSAFAPELGLEPRTL